MTKVKLSYMHIKRTSPTGILLIGEKDTEAIDGKYFQVRIEVDEETEATAVYENLKIFIEMAGCDCTVDIPCEKHKYIYESKVA